MSNFLRCQLYLQPAIAIAWLLLPKPLDQSASAQRSTEEVTEYQNPHATWTKIFRTPGVTNKVNLNLRSHELIRPRPKENYRKLTSVHLPIAVHLEPAIQMQHAQWELAQLERKVMHYQAMNWPIPHPDGGRSHTAGFDIFIKRRDRRTATAYLDQIETWGTSDTGISFGQVSIINANEKWSSLALTAYIEASLLGIDPTESTAWRKNTTNALLHATQTSRSWDTPQHHLLNDHGLEAIGSIHDTSPTSFLRTVWLSAQQNSKSTWPHFLSEPNLDQTFRKLGDMPLGTWNHWLLQQIERTPTHIVNREFQQSRLPIKIVSKKPIDPYELASYRIRLTRSPTPSNKAIKIWLHGEYGVRWLLAAKTIRNNSVIDFRHTLTRDGEQRYYLETPLRSAHHVHISVTQLGAELQKQADNHDLGRSYQLIITTDPL